ncbi:hypothetical protein DHEL01_v211834 [Diaporthe helianthi]|uniref:Uncharacterized protein n=1 Tax=Diaporthe helianthi TaxID=158607 RepID=A0A2P5HHQ2_DIAHE|nr:hypothetical protein DHEL01_v211834 [Diaporthe helianthi]
MKTVAILAALAFCATSVMAAGECVYTNGNWWCGSDPQSCFACGEDGKPYLAYTCEAGTFCYDLSSQVGAYCSHGTY